MSKVIEFINVECFMCGKTPSIIKIIDDIAMCEDCFYVEFETEDPIRLEEEKYNTWLSRCRFKVSDYRYTEDGITRRLF